ncbi:hypothetical protein OPV22_019645 [Ensete ventricosum]|uniref:Uncharacterized protein n=1 Tax=Ensete ventricosum TaxID=4639 RepID=A0AAV8QN83_ENSVE|nr:hypothetical protein OPV22_019645 [Ensete ventricosum]
MIISTLSSISICKSYLPSTDSVYKPTKEKNKKSEESLAAYGVYSMQQLLDSFPNDQTFLVGMSAFHIATYLTSVSLAVLPYYTI